ncbi:MID1-like protein [Saccharomyces kudriavzevii IFO 1802]|uniref:MID1-like protein n=1 Tax=Saccharomyces kudriavzevii (strain ATCC MYA-4449 / AS 2.2408 / CBS 8840 / NBRC 1802 / NCYC 2889) TaxID=226230 RepID=J5PI24_SACK1|nr:MID1-like protein [Saccharomyces kudriavzevii IFO 1802]
MTVWQLLFVVYCLLATTIQGIFQDFNPFANKNISLKFPSINGWGKNIMAAGQKTIINSDSIYEWTPILSNITGGKKDSFVFTIDAEASGYGFAPTYEVLMFISGNICHMPANSSDIDLTIYYSFNESILDNPNIGQSAVFQDGYIQALAISPVQSSSSNATSTYSNLYVVTELVNSTTNEPLLSSDALENWEYRLSISENDLVFQWDVRPWVEVLDTDMNSALLSTGNVTADAKVYHNYSIYDPSLYDIYVYSYEDSALLSQNYNLSLCAVKNGPHIVSSQDTPNATVTSNGTSPLERSDLAIQKKITEYGGSVTEMFYITGLNASTTYVAYLTKKISNGDGLSSVGGILFSSVYFSTRSTNTCSLIFDLDFCGDVAYSVPASSFSVNNKTLMAQTYDHIAEALYSNFSKALQLISCDADKDASYSPIMSCGDCAEAYRDWVCAVSIPRCSTTSSQYYIHRDKTHNRNDYLNKFIKPLDDYYEILPCIDMCYTLVRNCPSDFDFACPEYETTEDLLYQSYNYYMDTDYATCNYIGNSSLMKIHLMGDT